jgi:hypothetical protein
MNTRFITRIYRSFLFASASISLLSAGGGDDDPAVVNANPTGYYTGDADVYDGDGMLVDIQDLQGLVDGNRFMAMSEINELLYDGTITSISGNNFSATVKVYQDGVLVTDSPTSFSGQIQQGVQITGTFGGTGDWRGTFILGYSASNAEQAVLTAVASGVDEYWGGSDTNYNTSTDPQFRLTAGGSVMQVDDVGGGVLFRCGFVGDTFVPVVNTRLYRVTITASNCIASEVNGAYTGLATTKNSDATLVLMLAKDDTTNGDFANASDYIRRSPLPQNQ